MLRPEEALVTLRVLSRSGSLGSGRNPSFRGSVHLSAVLRDSPPVTHASRAYLQSYGSPALDWVAGCVLRAPYVETVF